MKATELSFTVDFKKWITIELQVILDQLGDKKHKLKFTTQTAFVEGVIGTYEPKDNRELSPLGFALRKTEQETSVEIQDKEIVNMNACIYLKDVKITPLVSPNTPIILDEFILFTDHILGLTL